MAEVDPDPLARLQPVFRPGKGNDEADLPDGVLMLGDSVGGKVGISCLEGT
jgi:hypothetical protein